MCWANEFINPYTDDTLCKTTEAPDNTIEPLVRTNLAHNTARSIALPIAATASGAHAPPKATHTALLASNVKAQHLSKKSGLPVIVAVPDSGATAHVTNDHRALINFRPWDDIFSQANGTMTRCIGIGDMPVIYSTF